MALLGSTLCSQKCTKMDSMGLVSDLGMFLTMPAHHISDVDLM